MRKTKEKCGVCGFPIKFDNCKMRDRNKKIKIARQCQKCLCANIPFSKITENEFQLLNTYGINTNDENCEFNFFSPAQISHLRTLNEVRQRTPLDDCDDGHDLSTKNCNYFSSEEFTKSKFDESKSFSVLHLNIHSVQKHIEEFKILLSILDHKFDVIAITESKLQKGKTPIVDISIEGYITLLWELIQKLQKVTFYST